MAISGLSPDVTVLGSIEIAVTLDGSGTGIAYGLEDITPESAIGYLQVVQDRLREERRMQWDKCPGCGEPWSEHDDFEEEDD